MKKKILVVIGTRPNFIKVTRLKKIAEAYADLELKIVHTGQHFDYKMADVFFEQLEIRPDYFLNVQPGTANAQMANIMLNLEQLIQQTYKPDLLLVVGDVNSTAAAALTANKTGVLLAHIESGLRSFDRSMPEEHNRIITDSLSDYFFVTEPSGLQNLLREGKPENRIFMVGNTMIDTLVACTAAIEKSDILEKLNLVPGQYVLMTMHRPATVDSLEGLVALAGLIETLTGEYQMLFPVHPRTVKNMEQLGVISRFRNNKQLILTEPLDYFAFQKLVKYAVAVVTDSGGIQEESTYLGVPCLTLRANTERPVTVDTGTNTLLPFDISAIQNYMEQIKSGQYKKGRIPDLWDGHSSERIIQKLHQILCS